VRGANAQGLDCLFLASGIHAEDVTGADGRLDPGKTAALLGKAGLSARYAEIALSW